jgi:hypothetical protein
VQDLDQHRVLGHRGAVDPVVGGHDGPRADVAHQRLERSEVELPQRAVVDARVQRRPLGLGVVGDEVFDGRGHSPALHAADERCSDPGGQQRIFAEALEVPAAIRRAVQVHRRRQQDVHALAPRLDGQQPAQPLDPRLVPGRGQRRRRRDVRRRVALVPQLPAHPGRPVRHHDPAQPDGRLRVQGPEVRAGQQPHLLLERQPLQTLVDHGVDRECLRGHRPPASHGAGAIAPRAPTVEDRSSEEDGLPSSGFAESRHDGD